MNPRKWKKGILIFGILFLLIFSFWYGGGSAGLQGFSSADNQKVVSEETKDSSSSVSDSAEEKEREEKSTKKDDNIFKQIVMNIKKKSGSSNTSKNTQNNKRAQKNANRAADKSKKKSKKSKKKSPGTSKEKAGQESSQNKETDDNHSVQGTENANQDWDADSNNTAENQNNNMVEEKDTITCTISISCAVLLDKMDSLPASKRKLVPSDGILLKTTTVKMKKESSVFDVLRQAAKDNNIHLEYSFTPIYKSYYIEGIGNLYQFDSGELSGWMYSVNGEFPGNGCSSYTIKSGDVIQWVYTCSLGKDVGSYFEE